MSKEKPEVGDVVKAQTGDIFTVIAVSQNAVRLMRKYPFIKIKTFSKSNYYIVFTYLGKSKVNIKELFHVAED